MIDHEEEEGNRVAKQIIEQQKLAQLVQSTNAAQVYERIVERVVGQDVLASLIANKVSDALLLEKKGRPRCSVFLSGEAGLGKTYMAEVTAEALFPHLDKPYCRIALGEVSNNLSLGAKLFGVSDSVQGGGKQGSLMPYLRANRRSGGVVIFDEIDKALKDYPGHQNLFLEMLEKGVIKNDDGVEESVENFILFFTANAAEKQFTEEASSFFPNFAVSIDQEKKRPVTRYTGGGGKPDIWQEFSEILENGGTFNSPFIRRLDLIAGVQKPLGDSAVVLARVLLNKILGQYAHTIKDLNDPESKTVTDTRVLPWLVPRIEDLGPARTERLFLNIFEEQLADILRVRVTQGLERKFEPRLSWDKESDHPLLLDAEAL